MNNLAIGLIVLFCTVCSFAHELQETIIRPTNKNTDTSKPTLSSLSLSTTPNAISSATPSEETEYSIYPYYWATTTDSTTKAHGVNLPLELGADDIFKATNSGIAILFKAKRGQSVMTLEVNYMDASGFKTDLLTPYGAIPVVINSEVQVLELWIGQRFGEGESWIELYLGARDIKNDAKVYVAGTSQNSNYNWHEPLLGQHAHIALTDRIALFARSSIGNLNGDELSYDGILGANFILSKRTNLVVGYRAQKLIYDSDDYDDSDKGHIIIKTKTHGPVISIAVAL